jgi:hypothetical protein
VVAGSGCSLLRVVLPLLPRVLLRHCHRAGGWDDADQRLGPIERAVCFCQSGSVCECAWIRMHEERFDIGRRDVARVYEEVREVVALVL